MPTTRIFPDLFLNPIHPSPTQHQLEEFRRRKAEAKHASRKGVVVDDPQRPAAATLTELDDSRNADAGASDDLPPPPLGPPPVVPFPGASVTPDTLRELAPETPFVSSPPPAPPQPTPFVPTRVTNPPAFEHPEASLVPTNENYTLNPQTTSFGSIETSTHPGEAMGNGDGSRLDDARELEARANAALQSEVDTARAELEAERSKLERVGRLLVEAQEMAETASARADAADAVAVEMRTDLAKMQADLSSAALARETLASQIELAKQQARAETERVRATLAEQIETLAKKNEDLTSKVSKAVKKGKGIETEKKALEAELGGLRVLAAVPVEAPPVDTASLDAVKTEADAR